MTSDIAQNIQAALQHHQAGRWQEAEAAYQTIIKEQPEHADAWHLLGVLSLQLGNSENAIKLIEKAIELSPTTADFYCNCGEAYLAQKQYDIAIERYQRAIELKPEVAGAHNNLGNVFRQSGQTEPALACYKKALSLQPDFFIAHNNLGICAKEAGKAEDAVRHYEKAIALRPDYAEAHNNMANALLDLKKSARAIEHYQQAVKIVPEYAEAHSNMGNAFRNQGKLKEAILSYRKALALQPEFAMAHYNLGVALDESGQPEEAITAYRKAIAIDADYADAHNNLAFTLQELGRGEEAVAAYKQTLIIQPDYAAAHLHLSMIAPAENNLAVINSLLQSSTLSETERSHYHFALGNIYNSLQQYDPAFEHYEKGNNARRGTISYKAEDYSTHVDKLIGTYNRAYFEKISGFGSDSQLPVFIIGLPRSGSTLIEQVLSSHPLIYGGGEIPLIGRLERKLAGELVSAGGYPDCMQAISRDMALEYAGLYLNEISELSNNVEHVTDKDPGNFHRIGLIKTLFPRARFIHCLRDPADTCLSIYFNYFSEGNEYSFDLVELGRYYRDYRRLMQHWQTLFADDILQVSYEELVTGQEAMSRRMLDFIGLEWDNNCLDFHLNKRPVRTASSVQVRQALYQSSMGRWKNYAAHLSPLLDILNN